MAGATHATLNDLPESARGQVIDLLNQRLADAIDLELQSKQAHWNVKGRISSPSTSCSTRFTPPPTSTSTCWRSGSFSWAVSRRGLPPS